MKMAVVTMESGNGVGHMNIHKPGTIMNENMSRIVKLRLVQIMVFPAATFRCENCIMKRTDRRKIELLWLFYTDKKTNVGLG